MNIADRIRNAHIWLPGYIEAQMRRAKTPPKRVWVMIADHFEPLWHGADDRTARERVALWRRRWPEIAKRHRDSTGKSAVYTFFYPQEEYRPYLIEPLAEMVQMGIADVEVHIHHDGEGERNFVDRVSVFIETLHARHGLMRRENGKIRFGFIHGNWALDNSRPDGRWCGLNNEITVLRDLGCYADFTLPSVPSATQTRLVNTIYWATDDPARPKSHDTGRPATPGGEQRGDLLMIPGPLALNWKRARTRFLPGIDAGELAAYARLDPERLALWLQTAPRLGDDLYLKLFTHGAQERNARVLLDQDLAALLQTIAGRANGSDMEIRYCSAYEMYRAIRGLQRAVQPQGVGQVGGAR